MWQGGTSGPVRLPVRAIIYRSDRYCPFFYRSDRYLPKKIPVLYGPVPVFAKKIPVIYSPVPVFAKKNTGTLRSGTGICPKKYRHFTVQYRYLQKKYRYFTVRYRSEPKKDRYFTDRSRSDSSRLAVKPAIRPGCSGKDNWRSYFIF